MKIINTGKKTFIVLEAFMDVECGEFDIIPFFRIIWGGTENYKGLGFAIGWGLWAVSITFCETL